MACFATPYGLRYAAHCFNRADAQNNRPALISAGGKLGVMSHLIKIARELKTTPAYLTGATNDPNLEFPDFPLSADERRLIEYLRKLTPKDKKMIIYITQRLHILARTTLLD